MKVAARTRGSWALILGLVGCRASVSADAQTSGDASGRASASADGELREFDKPLVGSTSSAFAAGRERVLLGARHDLKLDPARSTASCQCLAVGLGSAQQQGLSWNSAAPVLDATTQLAIALTSQGVDCNAEPPDSLGASYWGYRISGNDVIVLVEAALGGTPLTSGAVIPKPVGAGQVYVGAVSKKVPYGRALQGSGLCKIGNPGSLRSTTFSELELGENVPAARVDTATDNSSSAPETVP